MSRRSGFNGRLLPDASDRDLPGRPTRTEEGMIKAQLHKLQGDYRASHTTNRRRDHSSGVVDEETKPELDWLAHTQIRDTQKQLQCEYSGCVHGRLCDACKPASRPQTGTKPRLCGKLHCAVCHPPDPRLYRHTSAAARMQQQQEHHITPHERQHIITERRRLESVLCAEKKEAADKVKVARSMQIEALQRRRELQLAREAKLSISMKKTQEFSGMSAVAGAYEWKDEWMLDSSVWRLSLAKNGRFRHTYIFSTKARGVNAEQVNEKVLGSWSYQEDADAMFLIIDGNSEPIEIQVCEGGQKLELRSLVTSDLAFNSCYIRTSTLQR